MKIIVTGGAGFIGSNLIKYLLKKNHKVLNIDKITYASNLDSLNGLNKNKYKFKKVDIYNNKKLKKIFFDYKPDAIFHLAAESHVDRSIEKQDSFIKTNIVGTYNLLKIAREYFNNLKRIKKKNFRFIHISTDEVYGDLTINQKAFTENSKYKPSSPYSASKAASDHLASSWHKTFNLPIIITNCSNNYGPYHFPEKFIPHLIICGILRKNLPVYGNGKNIRDWIHVEDHVSALHLILKKGVVGKTYNIGGNTEKRNIDVANMICDELNRLNSKDNFNYKKLITFVNDRPGHDKRYAVNCHKIRSELKWKPKHNFRSGLKAVIKWYVENEAWWRKIFIKNYTLKRIGVIK
jgi:dTDP-glucose 4,6-dehydratase